MVKPHGEAIIYAAKVLWSNLLNTSISVDFDADFVKYCRADDDKCIFVRLWMLRTSGFCLPDGSTSFGI